MKQYHVALIGCGHMGAAHLEQIYYKENIVISCVCDRDEKRAREFAVRFGAKAIETDARACIAREDTDIVIIATYPSTHLELLKLCIQCGKHVMCEKPIAASLEEGKEFFDLVKANPQIKVMIGHILRYNATYRKAAEMIHNGAIGSPIIMRMSQNHHTMNWNRYARLIQETSPIIDCGVHYLDVMRWFTGSEILDVAGIGMRTDEDVPEGKCNYEMATVRMADGSVGYYEAGWTKTISSDNTKEFVGPKGSLRIIYQKDRTSHQEEGDLIEYYCLADKTYHNINVPGNRKPTDLQLEHLIRMIEEDIPAEPTIEDVFASFQAVLAAEKTIRR